MIFYKRDWLIKGKDNLVDIEKDDCGMHLFF